MSALIDTIEGALVAVLTPIAAAVTYPDAENNPQPIPCYTGKASATKSVPNVTCAVTGQGEEDPPFTGNYWFDATVSVRWKAEDDPNSTGDATEQRDLSTALSRSVQDKLWEDDFWSQIQVAGRVIDTLTVFDNSILQQAPSRSIDETGIWSDDFAIRLYCCEASLT